MRVYFYLFFLSLIVVMTPLKGWSQVVDSNYVLSNGEMDVIKSGSIIYYQDDRITNLLLKSKVVNETFPKVKGFRVQIFSVSGTSSKDKANKVKAEYLVNHPLDYVYIVYQAPYFKVRIGDFRDVFDANAYLLSIKGEFPYAFVVEDEVVAPKQVSASMMLMEVISPNK